MTGFCYSYDSKAPEKEIMYHLMVMKNFKYYVNKIASNINRNSMLDIYARVHLLDICSSHRKAFLKHFRCFIKNHRGKN